MGYIYMLCVALMFSFGGTCVKLISPYFDAQYISFFRFFIGTLFLILLKMLLNHKYHLPAKAFRRQVLLWIFIGALAKWAAYLTENYGLSHGPSYGNIVCQPSQAIFLIVLSVFLFHERITIKKFLMMVLCIGGVLCISWNGRPLTAFYEDGLGLMLLFVASGCFAGLHVLAQKMIADKMHIIDSNTAIFAIAALCSGATLIPSTAHGSLAGIHPGIPCILAIIAFGFSTGIGFYLNAKAIPLVPFYMVPLLQCTMVIFSIIWGMLFFHERITIFIIGGAAAFIVGIVGMQLVDRK